MNIVIYLVLWTAIGLLTGLIANWMIEVRVWPWFWIDLLTGFLGAILAGYFLTKALFGMDTVLSAYSLIFALFGAILLLAVSWLLRRVFLE